MKKLIAALLLGVSTLSFAQADYTFVYDGNAFLTNGITLYSEGKYNEAIKEFEKIVKLDPLFYSAQYEKALALAAGKDKEAAKAFYEEALAKGYMKEEPNFYMAYGSLLSDAKDYDKAELMFLEGEKLTPNSSSLLYNLALLYARKEEPQKCVDMLERAITINPNHAGSHYLLGLMALDEGRVTEGSMALLAYLVLSPESNLSESVILKLNEKYGENYLEEGKTVFSKTGGDNFEDINVILRNSLPLKKVYKVKSEFDDVIIRQVQAIAEYCVEHKGQQGFFETTYVPWLAEIVKQNQFEGFSYYILQGMRDKLGKKLTSQSKKIDAFTTYVVDGGFWEIFAKRKLEHFGKQEEVVVYIKNNKPYYQGKIVNGKKEGKFKVMNLQGNMSGELNMVNDDIDGLQKYYDDKGRLTEEVTYSQGKLNGKKVSYYENGNINTVENYKDDLLEGHSASYYVNGGKRAEGTFVNGEREGAFTYYHESGAKKTDMAYAKGKLSGKYVSYDEAGNISLEQNFENDERNGLAVEYYNGKSKKSEIVYKNGAVSSSYKYYYPDGTLKEETTYANDLPAKSVYFMPNGKKSYEAAYDKEGYVTSYSYYNGGEKFFEETYKNGEMKAGLQYGNGKTTPVEVANGKGMYEMKSLDGITLAKGKYEKGIKVGEWTKFYPSGVLSEKQNFDKGMLSGINTDYDDDGRVSVIAYYVNDTLSGVYESYNSGILAKTYHYAGGSLNGPAKTYYTDGSLMSESFYLNDVLLATHNYRQDGSIANKLRYEDGFEVYAELYDMKGKVESEINYANKNGKVNLSCNGGQVYEYDMVNGVLNGKYYIKNKNGRLSVESNYKNGSRHGSYTYFGPKGVPYTNLTYYAGLRDGEAKYYDMMGSLRIVDNFVMGDNTGLETRYFNNKMKQAEFTLYDGEKEGEVKYYNRKGENILIFGYDSGRLVYYVALDKDGKLTRKVPVVNETADIDATYPNGKKALQARYVKGVIDGLFAIYGAEGKPEYEAQYDMGHSTGKRCEYYDNGQLYKKENYKADSMEGLQEYFAEDGKPLLSIEYKNDEMHGLCKIYTNGKVTETLRYDSNDLAEVIK